MSRPDEIHPDFRLNGVHHDREGLREVAHGLIREGYRHEKEIGEFLLDWLSDGSTMEVRTSGSTGKPSKYRFTKKQMVHSAQATVRFFELGAGSKALLCLPARYIAGKMMLVRSMVAGMSLDYIKPTHNPLEDSQGTYDFCAMVPMQFTGSLEAMPRVRQLIIGGAPLGLDGHLAAQSMTTSVFETFGMTETISHIALRSLNLPGQLFSTLDGITVTTDSRGCLVVHAPAIAKDPVRTNDLVRLDSETAFEWLGRIDHVVNSGGIKLVPEQIEKKIQHLLNSRFFLTGLPDERLGQQLVMVLEGNSVPAALLDRIRDLQSIEPYEVPGKIIATPGFTVTDNGKIQRKTTMRKMGFSYD